MPTANNDGSLLSLGLPNINSLCSVVIMFTNPSIITAKLTKKSSFKRVMNGFLWEMFTCETLTCGHQGDFGGKHTQEFHVLGIFRGPSQISITSEFGLPDRTNWRDSPQSRNALPAFCFHGNDCPLLSLFRLVEESGYLWKNFPFQRL